MQNQHESIGRQDTASISKKKKKRLLAPSRAGESSLRWQTGDFSLLNVDNYRSSRIAWAKHGPLIDIISKRKEGSGFGEGRGEIEGMPGGARVKLIQCRMNSISETDPPQLARGTQTGRGDPQRRYHRHNWPNKVLLNTQGQDMQEKKFVESAFLQGCDRAKSWKFHICTVDIIDFIKFCQELSVAPLLVGSTSCHRGFLNPLQPKSWFKQTNKFEKQPLSWSDVLYQFLLGTSDQPLPRRTSVNVSYDYVLKITNFKGRPDERPCLGDMTNVLYGQHQFLSAPHKKCNDHMNIYQV